MGRNATFLDGSFAIMDQADQLRIMKECLAMASIDLKDSEVKPMLVLNALSDVKSKIFKGEDPFRKDPKKKIPKQVEIAQKIYGIYRENMLSNNLLDFDDLIYLSRELLMEHQEVRQQLHRRWTHILVVRAYQGVLVWNVAKFGTALIRLFPRLTHTNCFPRIILHFRMSTKIRRVHRSI